MPSAASKHLNGRRSLGRKLEGARRRERKAACKIAAGHSSGECTKASWWLRRNLEIVDGNLYEERGCVHNILLPDINVNDVGIF